MNGEVLNVMNLKTTTISDAKKPNRVEKENSVDFKSTLNKVQSKKERSKPLKNKSNNDEDKVIKTDDSRKKSNTVSDKASKVKKSIENSKGENDTVKVDQQTLKKVKDLLEKLGIEVSEEVLSQLAMKFDFNTIIDTLSSMKFINNNELDLSGFLETMEKLTENLENMKSFLIDQSVPELSENEIKMKFDHLLNKLNGKIESVEVSVSNKDAKESIKELLTFIKDNFVSHEQLKNHSEDQSKNTTVTSELVNQGEVVGKDQLINEKEKYELEESDVKVLKEEKVQGTDTKKVSTNETKSEELELKEQVKDPGLVVNKEKIVVKENQKMDFKEELSFRLLSKSQQSTKIFEQIKGKFTTKFDGKVSEMKVLLDPKSLGKVELKLTIEKGNVLAEFEVQSTMVKQAIESNLADLRNALGDKGYSLEGLDVSVNQENQEDSDQNQQYYENIFEESDGEENDSIALIEESKMLNILNRRAISYLG